MAVFARIERRRADAKAIEHEPRTNLLEYLRRRRELEFCEFASTVRDNGVCAVDDFGRHKLVRPNHAAYTLNFGRVSRTNTRKRIVRQISFF